ALLEEIYDDVLRSAGARSGRPARHAESERGSARGRERLELREPPRRAGLAVLPDAAPDLVVAPHAFRIPPRPLVMQIDRGRPEADALRPHAEVLLPVPQRRVLPAVRHVHVEPVDRDHVLAPRGRVAAAETGRRR